MRTRRVDKSGRDHTHRVAATQREIADIVGKKRRRSQTKRNKSVRVEGTIENQSSQTARISPKDRMSITSNAPLAHSMFQADISPSQPTFS